MSRPQHLLGRCGHAQYFLSARNCYFARLLCLAFLPAACAFGCVDMLCQAALVAFLPAACAFTFIAMISPGCFVWCSCQQPGRSHLLPCFLGKVGGQEPAFLLVLLLCCISYVVPCVFLALDLFWSHAWFLVGYNNLIHPPTLLAIPRGVTSSIVLCA